MKKEHLRGAIWWLVLLTALGVFVVSGWKLVGILSDYRNSNQEYESIAENYTKAVTEPAAKPSEKEKEAPAASTGASAETEGSAASESTAAPVKEEVPPPITVNWDELKAINPDIVGWIYLEGEPTINYPILHGKDNDEYLHRTFKRENRYAGSIFIDCENSGKWDEPNTVVYGHNMRNGSMFGKLKFMRSAEKYAANPYFWILTPTRNDRYQIYSMFETKTGSEVYTLFSRGGSEFRTWEEKMQKLSEVETEMTFSENDHSVVLSTCTSDSSKRCVVIGKRI